MRVRKHQGDGPMGEFVGAVIGFPTLPLTAALVVVVGFWLLVLSGVTGYDAFDDDLDTDALALGGVPVALSASLVIALAWLASLTCSAALNRSGLSGPLRVVLDVGVLVASAGLAYAATRRLVRTLHRLLPGPRG